MDQTAGVGTDAEAAEPGFTIYDLYATDAPRRPRELPRLVAAAGSGDSAGTGEPLHEQLEPAGGDPRGHRWTETIRKLSSTLQGTTMYDAFSKYGEK
jgi:hypothetical protein